MQLPMHDMAYNFTWQFGWLFTKQILEITCSTLIHPIGLSILMQEKVSKAN